MLKQELLNFVDNFQPLQVLVFGDLMLDHYIFGDVNRISPEAPVPIVEVQKENFLLGGAGSCVTNLHVLGNRVKIAAACGKDAQGNQLCSILDNQKNSTELLLFLDKYKTIVKSRVLSHKQQLLRIDYEQNFSLAKHAADELLAKIGDLKQFQAIILSDYGKGFCTPYVLQKLLQKAKDANIFTIVDPAKDADFTNYRKASCLKPNRLEAECFYGQKLRNKDDYLAAAAAIQKTCLIPTIALSLDSEGLLIYQGVKDYYFFHAKAQSVFDVTGAGDLVVTMLALTLSSGVATKIAGNIANIAASIAIKNLGSYHPTWQEIKQKITSNWQ